MLSGDGNVILLEVNHLTGIDFKSENNKLKFDKHLFNLIDEIVIEPSITGKIKTSQYPCVYE